MKRYVTEFANNELKCCTESRRQKIIRAVELCKKGYITDFEAVKMIVDSYYDAE